tara:strand:- start:2587 stop:2847 length:261 start_codon:yes stop_codon:yes gene_type:complete
MTGHLLHNASKSTAHYKHGAIITKNGKIYASGFNNPRTSIIGNELDCCEHAEMAAARQFINIHVRSNPNKYRFLSVKEKVKEKEKI